MCWILILYLLMAGEDFLPFCGLSLDPGNCLLVSYFLSFFGWIGV
jgi:hypothetical protein